MRRAALLIAFALVLAACGGSDEDAATTTTISDAPDGDVTTTEVRSEPGIPGVAEAAISSRWTTPAR